MNKFLAGFAALACAVAVLFATAYFLTRPQPPDLTIENEWTLVKAASLDLSPRRLDVKVYLYKRDSTESDPYSLRQNKIVVEDDNHRHEFLWPSEEEFAGSWVELSPASDRSVAIVLFEEEYVARVVLYKAGRFRFRPEQDELMSVQPLQYVRSTAETSRFLLSSSNTTWRWSVSSGFEPVKVGVLNAPNFAPARDAASVSFGSVVKSARRPRA